MSGARTIQIRSESLSEDLRELLRILESFAPVKFSFESNSSGECAGQLAIGDSSVANGGGVRLTIPSTRAPESALVELKIQFADDVDVPFPFRGRTLVSKAIFSGNYLQPASDEKILASCEKGPVWVISANDPKRYRSAFALPAFASERIFRDVFNGDRFVEMLPVLHFVREVCGDALLFAPPLRAGFIFDDPNLHWPRYGFVNFQQIAAHAEKENFHVSFATIPLDAWFIHAPTAQLFRNNPARLSLCIHGNNHTREELAQNYSPLARVSLLKQAIRRVAELERRANVRVCRVMVPPHGACSEEMLAELPGCGFEAACISHGSLEAYNKSKPWTRKLGFAPSESIAGCPVLPRWAMTGNVKNTILVAAFLGQPMILRGHHQDLKSGIEVLDELARFINGLGNVFWMNLTDLSRANYLSRLEGQTLRLQPLGSKVKVRLPKTATRLVFENSSNSNGQRRILRGNGKSLNGNSSGVELVAGSEDAVLVEKIAEPTSTVNGDYKLSPRAFIRRLLTESRDRLKAFS